MAQTLGVATSTLQGYLQQGESLSQVAQAQGVSSNSLISTIEQNLQSDAPAGAPAMSQDQLQQMATSIANRTPGQQGNFALYNSPQANGATYAHHGHHHHGGGGGCGGASAVGSPDATDSADPTDPSSSSSAAVSGNGSEDSLTVLIEQITMTKTSATAAGGDGSGDGASGTS